MPWTPKAWRSETNPLGPPAAGTATPLTGTALTNEFTAAKQYTDETNRRYWLGLNSNSLTGYGNLDYWPNLGVVYDRLEYVQPASCTGNTVSGQSVATALSNGMIPIVLIEPSTYGSGAIPAGAAITTFANYCVAQIQAVEAANPNKGILYEIVNEPWTTGFFSPTATAAQYADLVVGVWDACIAAGLDMTRIYATAQHQTWLLAMYAQQTTLGTKVLGWSVHPYGSPPPGFASSTGQGLAWVPQFRTSLTSGANNILISEVGIWDNSLIGGHASDESAALAATDAITWTREVLQLGQQYHDAGWLKALLIYARNDTGWATNLSGGALTAVGTAVSTWAQPTDPPVRSGYSVQDDGWLAVNMDPLIAQDAIQLTAGRVHFFRLRVDKRAFAQNLIFYLDTAGTTLTTGQCFAGIYNALGTLLDTSATQHTAWQSSGIKTVNFAGGDNFKPGEYFIAGLANGSTMPKFRGVSLGDQGNFGSGSSFPTRSMIGTATAVTTLPATIDFTVAVSRLATPIFCALS